MNSLPPIDPVPHDLEPLRQQRRAQVDGSEIAWTLTPHQHLETANPLEMDAEDVLIYAIDLQAEAAALRVTLNEALHALARTTEQRDRAVRLVDQLRHQTMRARQAA